MWLVWHAPVGPWDTGWAVGHSSVGLRPPALRQDERLLGERLEASKPKEVLDDLACLAWLDHE